MMALLMDDVQTVPPPPRPQSEEQGPAGPAAASSTAAAATSAAAAETATQSVGTMPNGDGDVGKASPPAAAAANSSSGAAPNHPHQQQEREENAGTTTAGGPASDHPPGSAASAGSTYDVESAKRLLMQAQRRTDIITTPNRQGSARSIGSGGTGMGNGGCAYLTASASGASEASSGGDHQDRPRGVLAAAGQWLERMHEQRRREELARQVEAQRRRLRRAIKRTSCAGHEDDAEPDAAPGLINCGRGDDPNGLGAGGGDGGTDGDNDGGGDHDRPAKGQYRRRDSDHRHHQGGGICGALSASWDVLEQAYYSSDGIGSGSSDTSTTTGGSSSPRSPGGGQAVHSPTFTPAGGVHVEVHLPDLKLGGQRKGQNEFQLSREERRELRRDHAQDEQDRHDVSNDDDDEEDAMPDVVVESEPPTKHAFSPYTLTPSQMKSIAQTVLPASVRYCRWKRLYSLARDGDSFDAFLRYVKGWKRTLLVVTTARGAVFGGYADSPWENQHHSLGATFYGSAQACLWRVSSAASSAAGENNDGSPAPSDIIVYRWTGANRYVQICDAHARVLAFGGGGNEGEFGLCVEDDFRCGSTGRCETFGNDPLCDQDRFDIVDLECWGFPSGFA